MLGAKIIEYQTLPSTQQEIWKRVSKKSIEDGTVIVTKIQTNGKRNTWESMVYK